MPIGPVYYSYYLIYSDNSADSTCAHSTCVLYEFNTEELTELLSLDNSSQSISTW